MRKSLLFAALSALALQASALEVTTTAGHLNEAVADRTATALSVSGTLDARDFKFIVDSLPQLTTLDLSGVQIEAYTDTEGQLLSSVVTYAAQALPHSALMGTGVSTVVLPDGLTAIGQAAFAGCTQLTSIALPESVTAIGDYAFSHTGLTEVALAPHVAAIGQGAFSRCAQLTSATIHSATIGADAFRMDTALANVALGDEVTHIGDGAFGGCTSLQAIGLGSAPSINAIGREAFAGSGLQQIALGSMTRLTSIGDWAFAGTALQEVAIPETVTHLGEGAFYYTRQLTQASMPAVSKVGDFTFAGNTSATFGELLAEGTERIGAYAFYADSAATHFVLPSSVTFIGTRAMAGMTGLEQLDVLGDVALLGDSVWAGVDQPAVRLDTRRDNDVSDLFAEAEQWKDFYILHDYLLGDANNDTRINVRDITTTVDYILDRQPAVFVFHAADVQTDQLINVRDVTGMTDIILDEDYSIIRAVHGHGAASGMPATSDRLVLPELSMGAGAATVEVLLENARPYNALQFDVVLPEGYRVTRCSALGRLSNHLTAMRQHDGMQRIVAYSVDNAEIAPGTDAVVSLTIEPDGGATTGSYIALNNIIFADLESDYAGTDYVTTFDSVTGVNDLAAQAACKVAGGVGVITIASTAQADAQVVAINGTQRLHHIAAGTTSIAASPGVYVVIVGGKSHKVVVK